MLYSAPVLKSPGFSQSFLSFKLMHLTEGSVKWITWEKTHQVAYCSKKLLLREVHYSTVEKECQAFRLATDFFRVYLLGHLFTIQKDHWALQWLDLLKDTNPRLARWSLALQPYQFVVEHWSGTHNNNSLKKSTETSWSSAQH